MPIMRRRRCRLRRAVTALSLSAVLTIQAHHAAGQTIEDLREAFRDEAQTVNFVAVFQALSFFSASPGISGASYTFGGSAAGESGTDVNLFKLPISHEFKSTDFCIGGAGDLSGLDQAGTDAGAAGEEEPAADPGAHCVRPYAELSLSYLRAKENVLVPAFGDFEIDFDIKTYSALAGGGVSIPLSKGTTFRPILLLGYSRVADDSDTSGVLKEVLDASASGIIYNVEINSLITGGAAELRHQRSLTSDTGLEAHIRYNHVLSSVLSASDSSLEQSNDFGVLTANAEINTRTGLTLFSRDLHVLGSLGGTYFPGEQGAQLQSDFYYEVGGGVEIKENGLIQGVEGFELFGRYILGDDVTGYSIGLSLTF